MKRLLTGVSIAALSINQAWAQGATLPPYSPPAAVVQDLTNTNACPFTIVNAGQSNAQGQDNGGSKTPGANILIANDKDAPTAFIPAAYGTAPLNFATTGITTDPTQVYKNPGEAMATELRARGILPASRPIVILNDWEGAKSISNWTQTSSGIASISGTTMTVASVANGTFAVGQRVNYSGAVLLDGSSNPVTITALGTGTGGAGTYTLSGTPATTVTNGSVTVSTDAYAVVDLWARLLRQLALFSTTYPGCGVNLVTMIQGENDSGGSTSYGSAALYLSQVDLFVAMVKALPQWQPYSLLLWSELGTWADNSAGQARNDAIRIIPGRYGAQVDAVSSAGDTETGIIANLGPHRDGLSIQRQAGRFIDKLQPAAGYRGVSRTNTTPAGSALAYPANITMGPASFTASISGQIMTVSAIASGTIVPGMQISGTGVTAATVLSQISGTKGSTGTYNVSVSQTVSSTTIAGLGGWVANDDVRSGARITLNGGAVQLPNAANAITYPLTLSGLSTGSNTSITALGTLRVANLAGAQTALTIKPGEGWVAYPFDGTSWLLVQTNIALGNIRRYIAGAVLTGTQTFSNSQINYASYTFNGVTATITPTFGIDVLISDETAASTITLATGTFDDGTTSLSLQPGQQVWLFGRLTGTNSLRVTPTYIGGIAQGVLPKLATAPSVAPGAGKTQIFSVAGTTSGTCKIQALAGTSTTAVTLVDNVGAGC